MRQKIYEYRDEGNWFIGRTTFANLFSSFGEGLNGEEIHKIGHLFDRLTGPANYDDDGSEPGLGIEVIELGSYACLFRFALDMLNDIQGRKLELVERQGALLVKEDQRLLVVYLPKDGVDFQAFLGLTDCGSGRFQEKVGNADDRKNL